MARILVIDDDSFVRSLVTRVLGREGHEVVSAEDGIAGLSLFKSDPFDLVITDILMPEKEGIELIMELREASPDLPVLAISGGGPQTGPAGPLHDAKLLGADASLAKPFEVEALSRVVAELLE
jgi:CheY-like chemotaxis protein